MIAREQVQKEYEATKQLQYNLLTCQRRYRNEMQVNIFTKEQDRKIEKAKTAYDKAKRIYLDAAERTNNLITAYNKACGIVPNYNEDL